MSPPDNSFCSKSTCSSRFRTNSLTAAGQNKQSSSVVFLKRTLSKFFCAPGCSTRACSPGQTGHFDNRSDRRDVLQRIGLTFSHREMQHRASVEPGCGRVIPLRRVLLRWWPKKARKASTGARWPELESSAYGIRPCYTGSIPRDAASGHREPCSAGRGPPKEPAARRGGR